MPRITRDGAAIAYEVTPAPAGAAAPLPTVVFLHNIMCDGRIFAHAVAALRLRFRTVAIDFRGHGESELPARPFGVADLAADVLAVMDQEGVARAAVVGLSLGATVAMEVALRAPARVERLVLLGADAAPDGVMNRVRNALFCQLVMVLGMRWFLLSAVLQTIFGRWFRSEGGARYRTLRDRVASLDRRVARAAMRAWGGRRPLLQEVGALRVPVRVVVGDEDVSCPLPCGQRLQAAIPGADLVRVARAGHTMPAERPEETTAAIASFLGEG